MAFLRAGMLDAREPAPSVETPLHSVLPYRFIVHTHDFATQALTDTARPADHVREALGDDAAYIDYVRPGFPLAREVLRLGRLAPARARPGAGQTRADRLGRHRPRLLRQPAAPDQPGRGVRRRSPGRRCRRSSRRPQLRPGDRAAPRRPSAGPPPPGCCPCCAPAWRAPARRSCTTTTPPRRWRSPAMPGPPPLAARGMATPEHILRCGRQALFVPRRSHRRLAAATPRRPLDAALDRFAAEHRAAFDRHQPAARDAGPDPPGDRAAGAGPGDGDEGQGQRPAGQPLLPPRAARDGGGRGPGRLPLPGRGRRGRVRVLAAGAGQAEAARARAVAAGRPGHRRGQRHRPGHRRPPGSRGRPRGADGRERPGRWRTPPPPSRDACKDRHRVQAVTADVTRAGETAAAITQAVLGFGGLDILVANAGFVEAGPIDEISEQAWDRHFEVNVKGYFLAVREAVRVMKLQRPRRHPAERLQGRLRPDGGQRRLRQQQGGRGGPDPQPGRRAGPPRHPGQRPQRRLRRHPADARPDRPARRPEGHHPRAAGRGVPPAQPAEASAPSPPTRWPRRRCSWCRRAPLTPPAPRSRSTAASRKRCLASWRANSAGSGGFAAHRSGRSGVGLGACRRRRKCWALAPARLGSVRRSLHPRAQVGVRPVAVHVEREDGNSPKPTVGWSSRSPRTALFPDGPPVPDDHHCASAGRRLATTGSSEAPVCQCALE